MKILLLIILVTLGFLPHSLAASTPSRLPTLHEIKSYTFQRPYDCEGDYNQSGLFLSDFSKQTRSPDLLFRGACGAERTIDASMAGDDFSVVADLGTVALESVTAAKAMNYDQLVDHDNLFRSTAIVKAGHTYAVLSTKKQSRALFVLHVDSVLADGQMKVRYAVKSYSIQQTLGEAAGFNWDQGNK